MRRCSVRCHQNFPLAFTSFPFTVLESDLPFGWQVLSLTQIGALAIWLGRLNHSPEFTIKVGNKKSAAITGWNMWWELSAKKLQQKGNQWEFFRLWRLNLESEAIVILRTKKSIKRMKRIRAVKTRMALFVILGLRCAIQGPSCMTKCVSTLQSVSSQLSQATKVVFGRFTFRLLHWCWKSQLLAV